MGIGSIIAASLVAPGRQASAIAFMFSGLTLANLLGVPAGTWLAQTFSWRLVFWIIAGIGVLKMASIAVLVPHIAKGKAIALRNELRAFVDPQVLLVFWAGVESQWVASISVFLMAAFGFATVSPIQKLVMERASHAGAPTMAASVNIGMFNLGNALGAWAGGVTIAAGFGLASPNWAGAILSFIALGLAVLAWQSARKGYILPVLE